MPCLFASGPNTARLENLQEFLFIIPDGFDEPSVELHFNGMIDVAESETVVTFVHRGLITGVRNATSKWADVLADKPDFISNLINEQLAPGRVAAIDDAIQWRSLNGGPPRLASVFAEETEVGDTTTRPSGADAKSALYSYFPVTFHRTGLQLFRLAFRTAFGLGESQTQLWVSVQGPDSAIDAMLYDIGSKAPPEQRGELQSELGQLYAQKRPTHYEVVAMSHPWFAFRLESSSVDDVPRLFAADAGGPGTPFNGPHSDSRGMVWSFGPGVADFSMNLVIRKPMLAGGEPLTKEIVEMLQQVEGQ